MSRHVRLLALLGVCVLVFAACDSGDDASPPPSSSTTPTTVAAPPVECGNPVASLAPDGALPRPGQMPANTHMAAIQARGRLIAAVSADTLLFGFHNPLSGNLEGFDIDMVRRVAQAIFGDPNRVEYKVVSYAQRIPALLDGSADIVADVMTVNCERWQQIDFSSQYFDAGQKVLVATDSPVASIADLNGKKMCVAEGSTNFDNMKNYPEVIPVPVESISDCMVLFQQGEVDAVTGDDTVLAGFVAQDPFAKVVGPPITSEPYGLGIAKVHPEFVRFVNGVLEGVRSDGTWREWYTRWLQPDGPAPQPPPAVYGRQP